MNFGALGCALAQVLHAVPFQPPLSELSVMDVVVVDESTGTIKRNGERITTTVYVRYEEAGFYDKHLVESGVWSKAVEQEIHARLTRCGKPVDLAIVDEEIEIVENDIVIKHLKPGMGVVVRLVTARLDALCEPCDNDDDDAEYLTNDDSPPLREVLFCERGIVGAEVLCVDGNGNSYRLSEKLFGIKHPLFDGDEFLL